MDSHAYFLREQGADEKTVRALAAGKLEEAPVSEPERQLLFYVRQVTEAAYRTQAEDVEHLRQLGWSDAQVAEAVYVAAMFAFFNRVADAFGLEPMGYLASGRMTP